PRRDQCSRPWRVHVRGGAGPPRRRPGCHGGVGRDRHGSVRPHSGPSPRRRVVGESRHGVGRSRSGKRWRRRPPACRGRGVPQPCRSLGRGCLWGRRRDPRHRGRTGALRLRPTRARRGRARRGTGRAPQRGRSSGGPLGLEAPRRIIAAPVHVRSRHDPRPRRDPGRLERGPGLGSRRQPRVEQRWRLGARARRSRARHRPSSLLGQVIAALGSRPRRKDVMGFMDTLKKWFGSAKETASEAAEKAAPYVEKAKEAAADVAEKAAPYVEKAKDAAADVAEKAAPYVEKAKDAATDAVEKIKESVSGAEDAVADKADDVADAADDARDAAADAAGEAKDAAADAVEEVEDAAADAADGEG